MEDFINPAKEVDSDKYWTRPNDQRQWLHKGEISLLKNRMYSQLFDTQITDENKLNSASAWVQELMNALSGSRAYNTKHPPLSENSQARSKYKYSRLAKSCKTQLPKVQLSSWRSRQTSARYFVVSLNDTFKRHRRDVISRETFATFTFAQVITKTRDFEDGFKTASSEEILTVLAILCLSLNWKSYLLLR